jgi:hypothetical protein
MKPSVSGKLYVLLGVMITGIGIYAAFRVLHVLTMRAENDPPSQIVVTSPAPAKHFIRDTSIRVGQMKGQSLTSFHRNPPTHLIPARQLELKPEDKPLEYLIANAFIGLSPLFVLFFSNSVFQHRRVPTFDVLDLDPPGLTALFQAFAGDIQSIGNPRKIKRLSNKIRFQYHYLALKGFTDAHDFDLLARMLIQIEKEPPSPNDTFKTFRTANRIYHMSDRLAQIIYNLNRDAFC